MDFSCFKSTTRIGEGISPSKAPDKGTHHIKTCGEKNSTLYIAGEESTPISLDDLEHWEKEDTKEMMASWGTVEAEHNPSELKYMYVWERSIRSLNHWLESAILIVRILYIVQHILVADGQLRALIFPYLIQGHHKAAMVVWEH